MIASAEKSLTRYRASGDLWILGDLAIDLGILNVPVTVAVTRLEEFVAAPFGITESVPNVPRGGVR